MQLPSLKPKIQRQLMPTLARNSNRPHSNFFCVCEPNGSRNQFASPFFPRRPLTHPDLSNNSIDALSNKRFDFATAPQPEA